MVEAGVDHATSVQAVDMLLNLMPSHLRGELVTSPTSNNQSLLQEAAIGENFELLEYWLKSQFFSLDKCIDMFQNIVRTGRCNAITYIINNHSELAKKLITGHNERYPGMTSLHVAHTS